MQFESPDALNDFISEVRAGLQAAGFQGAADRLGAIQNTAFTTGSEWLGELGLAVKEIRRERGIPPPLDAKLKQILKEVHRVWPML